MAQPLTFAMVARVRMATARVSWVFMAECGRNGYVQLVAPMLSHELNFSTVQMSPAFQTFIFEMMSCLNF